MGADAKKARTSRGAHVDGGDPKPQLCAFWGARSRVNTIINRVRSIPRASHRTSPCGTAAQELVLLYFPSGLFVYSWISRRFVFSVTSVRPILLSRHAINRPLQTAKYEKEKCTSATPRHAIAHPQSTRDEGHERTRTGKNTACTTANLDGRRGNNHAERRRRELERDHVGRYRATARVIAG